ncbi:hypothetical protein BEL04_02775 [Mucilaginibacter sp. PPCGB 2223]|uniref:M28 family metallopeptidase n=1 Tax=Mucilaginibacter sp. PPCGB 2223 TaxID=1886027 RepID=UPI00082528A7|nr:M28 family peptidase [Mucilaginibacter sp. PPCGB 2223]OCX53246.1 hypothetical protein BEL04_02775 [Mucilaginibacter sp. PPCGB 2223]
MKMYIAILWICFAFTAQAQAIKQLKQDMYGIASDATEGRFTGSPGYLKAAHYVAAQLTAAGIKTTFQAVPFLWDNYDGSSITINGTLYSHKGGNFIVLQYSAQVINEWLVLKAMPDSLETAALIKRKAGVVLLPNAQQTGDWETTVIRQYRFGYMHYAADGEPPYTKLSIVMVSPALTGEINNDTKPVIDIRYERDHVRGYNVIAKIPGTDQKLKNKIIIAGAHLDHIGRLGAHIYNGANDDGSGCVALMATARLLVKHPVKRPTTFVFYCGEELNLMGSRYFMEHPPVPVKNILMNINLEQVGSKHRSFQGIWAVTTPGFEQDFYHSGKDLPMSDLKYSPADSLLNEIANTDTYNFLNKNIPSVLLSSGGFDEHHSPLDKIGLIDFGHLQKVALLLNKFITRLGNN